LGNFAAKKKQREECPLDEVDLQWCGVPTELLYLGFKGCNSTLGLIFFFFLADSEALKF
jgi:hypothetical protein